MRHVPVWLALEWLAKLGCLEFELREDGLHIGW